MAPIIRAENISRIYELGGEAIHAVNDASLEVEPGKLIAVVGPSGSGKTTLLNLISGLDEPGAGTIWFNDRRFDQMSRAERLAIRRDEIGFVFQAFGLLPLLTAAENVSIPLRMQRLARQEQEVRIQRALESVDLVDRKHHRPYELSGGEQQRVAIARSLVTHPKLILADEPTGQLDSLTGRRIIQLLRMLVHENALTALIATHDPNVMKEADIVYEMRDGHLTETHRQ